MSYANGRTPAPVDQDGALDFTPPAPAKRQRGVSIQLSYHGALVNFTFDAATAPQVVEIEQSIDTLLKREGWAGVPTVAAAPKPKAERVKPFYDGNGDPCCPVHRKPLKEGQYGLYCSCKAKDGEAANDKGYCNLRFVEG
jgi:hypothetical protein